MSLDTVVAATTTEERFLRASQRCWHPLARSADLPAGTLRATTLLSRPLVVWRDNEGKVAAVDGVCAHRSAALAEGSVTSEGCLRCVYHGWQYNQDGRCVFIPQAPEAPIPARAAIRSYRCTEAADLVWVWLDEDEPTELPFVPESLLDGWAWVLGTPFTWEANAVREIENYCDMAHFSILHTGTFGDTNRPEVDPYHVETSLDGTVMEWQFEYPMVDRRQEPWVKTPTHWTYRIRAPFACSIELRDPMTRELRRIFVNFAVPTDVYRTEIFYGAMFRRPLTEAEVEASFANSMAIFEEDRFVVEGQRPRLLDLEATTDLSASFDRYSVAYRRALTSLGF